MAQYSRPTVAKRNGLTKYKPYSYYYEKDKTVNIATDGSKRLTPLGREKQKEKLNRLLRRGKHKKVCQK